jgi:hypothetical protein|tara:strand:+ start:161 stop:328 length:168 start_codon:yes stop_codon:yes gene_type:complete
MKWTVLVKLGKYFGVIKKKDADIWVEPDPPDFYFEIDNDGALWVVPENEKEEPSN